MSVLFSILTHFMPLVCFLPPEDIRKPVVFLCFQRVLKKTEGKMYDMG